jgi:hypothetical protein
MILIRKRDNVKEIKVIGGFVRAPDTGKLPDFYHLTNTNFFTNFLYGVSITQK